MSRIGKLPIAIPKSVKVINDNSSLSVTGPLGILNIVLPKQVNLSIDDEYIKLCISDKNCKKSKSLWGLFRALINNMVVGVQNGFCKNLVIYGVGYKADLFGRYIKLSLGKSHDIFYEIPNGIEVSVPKQTEITITGINKQVVSNFAAEIKRLCRKDPYKGKGIYNKDQERKLKKVKK
ncbi:50S ribosomal protein L6 [Lyticum sinuosum]|uniref:50S ribosomal protein L6 n=1 Tax=Lyticum sinuosum TaxID=1332059 RepID=A0AAE4VK61_9RICK|nr:50S ribosomal protein L6 [Lyticum sinuosum]MDZ5761451.1 50S ribosomal protein L6 [Lyticum sinuosum]